MPHALEGGDVAALESRTEGWVAGLQMAAVALRAALATEGDAASFVQDFTGDNRFILDYLIEEVLQHQPAHIQAFLLQTSILERLCGPLCDAVMEENGDWRMETDLHTQSPFSTTIGCLRICCAAACSGRTRTWCRPCTGGRAGGTSRVG